MVCAAMAGALSDRKRPTMRAVLMVEAERSHVGLRRRTARHDEAVSAHVARAGEGARREVRRVIPARDAPRGRRRWKHADEPRGNGPLSRTLTKTLGDLPDGCESVRAHSTFLQGSHDARRLGFVRESPDLKRVRWTDWRSSWRRGAGAELAAAQARPRNTTTQYDPRRNYDRQANRSLSRPDIAHRSAFNGLRVNHGLIGCEGRQW